MPPSIWPQWPDVVALWNASRVPEIEVRAWVAESQHEWPWEYKDDYGKRRYYDHTFSPPVVQTAFHLIGKLPRRPEEERIAFKLDAFCRETGLDGFRTHVVNAAYRALDPHGPGNWWHAGAKHVTPAGAVYEPRPQTVADEAAVWRDIVGKAAAHWTSLANGWVLIRVPALMDHDSNEYKEYQRLAEAHFEPRERAEYARLHAKYGEPKPPVV